MIGSMENQTEPQDAIEALSNERYITHSNDDMRAVITADGRLIISFRVSPEDMEDETEEEAIQSVIQRMRASDDRVGRLHEQLHDLQERIERAEEKAADDVRFAKAILKAAEETGVASDDTRCALEELETNYLLVDPEIPSV